MNALLQRLGRRITLLRKQRSLSRAQLAERLGYPAARTGAQRLSLIERGLAPVSLRTLREIAEALDVQLEVKLRKRKVQNAEK